MKENQSDSTVIFQATLFQGDLTLATGEVRHYNRSNTLSFFPSNGEILDTPSPEATMSAADRPSELVRIVNLRQCSASKTHWDFELAQ